MKAGPRGDAELAWEVLVTLVMESRGHWRRKVSEATGLSFSRVRALKRLQGEPRTLGELADDMGTDAPAATVIVNDLEARGLVQRQAHPDNRRCKLVSLTEAGRRAVDKLMNIDDPPPAAFAALPSSVLVRLQRLLKEPGSA